MTEQYLAVIRGDVTEAGREHEPALNAWWSEEHVPLFVARDGFTRAWRLQTVQHAAQRGDPGQKYLAVYEVDKIDTFTLALAEDQPAWGPFHDAIDGWLVGWGRTYYRRLLSYKDAEVRDGAYWAIVKVDPVFSEDGQDDAFRDWYNDRHVPEICSAPGIHAAWRLEVAPDVSEIGPHPHRFWAVYSVDSPDSFAAALAERTARGIQPFDGLWGEYMRDWAISFHEVILALP